MDEERAVNRSGSGRDAWRVLREIVETLVLTVVVFVAIQTFLAQPYEVEQLSMERTLEPGQFVLVDKLTVRWDGYDRGDIVVLRPPPGWARSDDAPFIKRVIGVGGDVVEVREDGRIYVNGGRLDEPYVYRVDGSQQPTSGAAGQSTWHVPPDEVFVMGDHRSSSVDSRAFGPIPVDDVIGRAWLSYWPLDRFGLVGR